MCLQLHNIHISPFQFTARHCVSLSVIRQFLLFLFNRALLIQTVNKKHKIPGIVASFKERDKEKPRIKETAKISEKNFLVFNADNMKRKVKFKDLKT